MSLENDVLKLLNSLANSYHCELASRQMNGEWTLSASPPNPDALSIEMRGTRYGADLFLIGADIEAHVEVGNDDVALVLGILRETVDGSIRIEIGRVWSFTRAISIIFSERKWYVEDPGLVGFFGQREIRSFARWSDPGDVVR